MFPNEVEFCGSGKVTILHIAHSHRPRNHRERVQEATESSQGLWKLAKWARNREQRQPFTPPLRYDNGPLKTEIKDKVELLKASFFPQ